MIQGETAAVTQTSSPGTTIPTRRVDFEATFADLPKHFAQNGNVLASHLTVALSTSFPDGEDFFVRSVRHYRDQITDPELKRQVAGFIGQETVHGREHRALNRRLGELGYPVATLERFTDRGLRFQERMMSPISNLANTAALEHLTATLAERILTDPELRDLFGPAVADVFIWHALEECEHKAVAFDVYRAVGGTERQRIRTMKQVRIGFVIGNILTVTATLLGDRSAWRRGVLRRSWREFRRSPLMRRDLWAQLKEYDRPGFHPNDRDTQPLVDHWREQLFGPEGDYRHLLTGSAARSSTPS